MLGEQLTLPGHGNEPEDTSTRSTVRGRWLVGGARIMRAIAAAPSLLTVLDAAGRTTASTVKTSNRGGGEEFEHAVGQLLTDFMQACILREVIDALDGDVADFGEVCDIRWQWLGGGRQRADFLVTIKATKRTVTYPVNLKTEGEGTSSSWSFAVAAQTLCRVAIGRQISDTASVDVDEIAVRWLAGERKLKAADYFLLIATRDAQGRVTQCRAQGLLSTVRKVGGQYQLAIRRQFHRSQDIEFVKSDELLPDGFDVNLAFAEAMLPQPPRDYTMRALTLAQTRARGAHGSELRAQARLMLGGQ